MPRGRPIRSQIRQNIVEIMYFLGKGYAYDIYKIYLDLFPRVTQRSIYYHLKKGLLTKEFIVKEIKREKGDYSWGSEAEKIYYGLGENASAWILPNVKKYFDEKRKL